MSETRKEYAIFYAPINPDANIQPNDAYLFQDPIKTYPIGTPEPMVFRNYATARDQCGIRRVGSERTEVRLILKVRHVHYTAFVKVTGIDRMPTDA